MSGLRTVSIFHHSPSSLKSLFSSSLRSLFSSPRRPAATLSFSSSTSATASMAAAATIEHVVLFKVRDSTDPSKVDAMVSNLRSLASLDVVAHLAAGPVLPLPHRSATGFTHLLHSRYRSKADLAAYSTHPTHAAVVEENVLPVCEDIMAMDWVADLDSPTAAPPGSAMRLTLAKPKEGGTAELTATLAQVKLSAPAAVTQVSYGENFSPARAKGYGVGLLAVFRNLEELEAMDAGEKDLVESVKAKVRPLLESFIVVDFQVPPPPAATL